MEINNIFLIGGSGFLGSHVAHLLSGRGYSLTVPTRRRERAKHLLPLPTTDVVEAKILAERLRKCPRPRSKRCWSLLIQCTLCTERAWPNLRQSTDCRQSLQCTLSPMQAD
jgi:hypothetical protein